MTRAIVNYTRSNRGTVITIQSPEAGGIRLGTQRSGPIEFPISSGATANVHQEI